ncbi:hypothetical protein KP509_18G032900 [Ceratopteris richardii]|uniref:ADF-H domain-containing protein n=1 Tax=Ceratopteris richardii TaxID=49495 RepID=A0A8T2SQ54_CERRI|nr:hypothetical protein KP509_18G032900 [Ceratopteris richardii]
MVEWLCVKRNILTHYCSILALKQSNAVSGIAVDNDCKLKFLDLKSKRLYRYIIYKIDDKSQQIVVEKLGAPDETYDAFTGSLPEKDCRYAIYDYDFVTEENCQKSKIFFVAWSPDVSRVRTKMLYASSKDRFKRELDVTYEVQATDSSEIEISNLKEKAY